MNYNGINAYRNTSVKTAGQGKLIIMLYDECIKQLDIAIESIESKSKKLDAVHNSIVKSQDIVTELMVSLDFEKGGDIAKNLFSLYMYFNQQLVDANISKESEPLKLVRKLMDELRDAWRQVAAKAGPVADPRNSGVNIAG